MTFKQFQKHIQGKVFLIGLTFIDIKGELVEQYQSYGSVLEITSDGFIKILRKDKSVFQMPYDNDTIKSAEKGEYKLRATKEIIIDPDFIMTWEITTTDRDNLEQIKEFGFIPQEE